MKTKTLLTLLCTMYTVFTFAASYTWTGTTSTAWGTSTNWSPNGIPGAADNVTIVSTANQPVYNGVAGVTNLTMTSGTLNLGGYTINVTGTGTFNGGTVNNGKISLNNSGTVTLAGTVFNCKFTSQSNTIYFNGSTFNDTTQITRKSAGSGVAGCTGGNKFYGYTVITNESSGSINLSNSSPYNADTAFNTFIVNINGTGGFGIGYGAGSNYNTFYGQVYINKGSSSTANDATVAYSGKVEFHDTVWVSNTSTRHVYLGNNSGSSVVLKNDATLKLGASGFTGGNLYLKYFNKQNSNTNINLSLGSSVSIYIGPSSTINGTFTSSSANYYLNGCTYNDDVSFTRSGSSHITMDGGNVFNGAATFASTSTGNTTFANTNGDDFNGDVIFSVSGGGVIYPAYNKVNYFAGNITTNGGSLRYFGGGASANMTVFDGTGQQVISGSTTTIRFKKLTLNKSSGYASLSHSINVTDSLKFVTGIMETGTYSVELNDNCKATGASNSSYIEGKVKKTGNDVFTFPVGRNGLYRSIAITAPSVTTDAYTAEYFNLNSNSSYSHSSKDGTLNALSTTEYWMLDRNTGSSNVSVTLSWDTIGPSCSFTNAANLKVASWNGTTWKDRGNGGTTGNLAAGTVVSNGTSTTYGAYALGTSSTFYCVPCYASAGTDSTIFISNEVQIGETRGTDCLYSWTPDSDIDYDTIPNPTVSPSFSTIYKISVTNSKGCVAKDDVFIGVDAPWFIYYDPAKITVSSAKSILEALPGVDTLYSSSYFTRVVVNMDTLYEDEIEGYSWVTEASRHPKFIINNDDSRSSINSNDIQASPWGVANPYNLDGTGVQIGQWDGGQIAPHDDYNGRYANHDTWNIGSVGNVHSCNVAGTLIGDGTRSAISGGTGNQWAGFAPEAEVDAWCFCHDISQNWDTPIEMVNGISTYNLDIINNSWGQVYSYGEYDDCELFGAYHNLCGEFDRIVRNEGVSIVFGSGNQTNWTLCNLTDVYGSILPYGTAKNVITVGGIDKTDALYSLSGCGPTNDGRLKPDVVAVAGIYGAPDYTDARVKTTGASNQYMYYDGTSAATPAVTGTGALLIEHFRNLNSGATPIPSLLKAILLNTATDLENPGPDYLTGYGKIDALKAVKVIDQDRYLTDEVADEAFNEHEFTLDCKVPELKVMLAYTDIEVLQNLQTNEAALVNNLDIELWDPNGIIYYLPLTLDPGNPANDAVEAVNSRDNVEQVVVKDAIPGTWTIKVIGTNVPQGPQEYAVTWEHMTLNPTITLTNQTWSGSTLGGLTISSNTISNQDFAISGVLTINNDLILDNCNILMGADADIVVNAGNLLTITNSTHIHGCSAMWDAITVPDGAEILINGNSMIEDAEYGVYIQDGADYEIDDAVFNKNYVHVYLVSPINSPDYPAGTITDSKFLCQTTSSIGTTPSYTTLLSPRSTQKTSIGIFALGALQGLTAGTNGHGNEFSNADYGIWGYDISAVLVQDNIMQDIDETGITFTECAPTAYINILDNNLSNMVTGIMCFDNTTAEITIRGNTIDFENMDSPPDEMFGIVVAEVTPSSPNKVSITENDIRYAPTGISITNLEGDIIISSTISSTVHVGDNDVTHAKVSQDAQSGILITNCLYSSISDNRVSNPDNDWDNWWETGIRQDVGNSNFFTCNSVHDVGRGFYFSGDVTPGAYFAVNKMEKNETGLFLNWAVIGQQGSSGYPADNEWNETGGAWWSLGSPYRPATLTYGDHADGSASPFYVQNTSVFHPVENDNDNNAPFPITMNNTSGSWSGGECPIFTAPSFKTEENSEAEELLRTLDRQPVLRTTIDSSLHYMGRYGLYKKLNSDAGLRAEHNRLEQFHTQRFYGNMGKLERLITNANRLQPSEQTAGRYLDTLRAMEPENKVELRLKQTLGMIYSNLEEGKRYNDNHTSGLREIAELCPYTDGFGVYIARALLQRGDSSRHLYFNECEATPAPLSGSYKTDDIPMAGDDVLFKIYPNPNTGNMIIEYGLMEEEEGYIEIINLAGNRIFVTALQKGKNQMPLTASNLAGGIYFVTIVVNEQQRHVQKIIIQKE